VIQIDVHPVRENSTNTTRTLLTPVHVCPAYASSRRSPYVATFHTVINRFEQIHCTRKEMLPTQSITRRSSDPRVRTQLLSHNSQCSSGEKSSFCWQLTTRLTGPISPVCDRYIQYIGGAGLPRTHSPTFPTSCFYFSLRAPTGLHFNQVSLIKPKCWV
jgi:hypothetical protein